MIERLAFAAAALLLTACVTVSTDAADIFKRPGAYLEQEVRVCGYIRSEGENNNIWMDRNAWRQGANAGLGLRIQPYNLLADEHDQNACITGVVIRTGCGEETICTDSNFPYALRVVRHHQAR